MAKGLRKMSVVHLKKEDVDFEERAISVIQKRFLKQGVRLTGDIIEWIALFSDFIFKTAPRVSPGFQENLKTFLAPKFLGNRQASKFHPYFGMHAWQ
ncbi:MAG: hypothetical protein ACP5U1_06855 [Desulfomonilaceae bacterium]